MVAFEIRDKVGLVTGGASGLGLKYALGLLEKGARGVTLADVNEEVGKKAIQEIEQKYGKSKAIFVKTDVTNKDQFEVAFKKTIDIFKNIDLLINNAGILNDAIWEKEIAINVNGTIYGTILGLDNYLPKYKSGDEAVILNVSSVAGIAPFGSVPIYTATKFAVHGLTISWGLPPHYERTKVKVIGVCPGVTMTPLITDMPNRNLGPAYEELRLKEVEGCSTQEPDQMAPYVIEIIEKAETGTMWVVEGGEPPYQFQLPDRLSIPKVSLK